MTFDPFIKKQPTQLGEPAGDGAVDLIQNNDGDEIDDGGGGLDGGPDVGARRGVRAHVQQGLDGDPVQDDAKDDGERHRDLGEDGHERHRMVRDGKKQADWRDTGNDIQMTLQDFLMCNGKDIQYIQLRELESAQTHVWSEAGY